MAALYPRVPASKREPERPTVRLITMRPSCLCAALFLIIGGCATTDRPSDRATGATQVPPTSTLSTQPWADDPAPPSTGPGGRFAAPPPIRVRGGGTELALRPWTYCWSGEMSSVCADGRPDDSPPDLGDPDHVEVRFDVPGWRFTATAVPFGDPCGRAQSVDLEPTGPTTYRLDPIGAAGDYVITFFGRGTEAAPQRGDVSASFRWHTPRRGPTESPAATVSVVGGRGQDLLIYGAEVSVSDLRTTPGPGRITAGVLVTNADGSSFRMNPERRDHDCQPEGSVFFTADRDVARPTAKSGPAPVQYEVTLVIDSKRYVGTGTWPVDVDEQCSPCTRLRFSPPLPGI